MMESPEILPCGCVLRASIENGKKVLTVSPCNEDCPNLAAVIEVAAFNSKPVERRG